MGGMFLIGLCSQKFLGPPSKDCVTCIAPDPEKQSGLFTPPRYRFSSKGSFARPTARTVTRKNTRSSSSDFELGEEEEDGEARSAAGRPSVTGGGRRDCQGQEAGEDGGEEQQRKSRDKDPHDEYDEDEAFILGGGGKRQGRGGVWERASAGTKR